MIEGYLRRLGLMDAGGPVDYLDPQRMNLAKSWPTSGAIDSGINPQMTRPVRSSFPNPADYAGEPPSRIGQAIDDYRAGKRDDTGAMLASAATNVASMPLKMMTLEGMYGLGKSAYDAFTTPYRVLTSPEPVTTEQMIEPAANIALTAPLGGLAVGRMAPVERVAYSNSKEGALPGLVLQGYRGHNPDLGIGPRPDKVQAVFATPDEFLAQRFAKRPEGDGVVSNVEMRFKNPYVVDAKGNNFDNVPVRDGSNFLSRLLSPTMRYNIDDLAREKAAAGHDGMIVKNVRETGAGSTQHTADQYAALQRGTVYDPATGNLLWSNSKEASLPGLLSQGGEKPKSLMERLANIEMPPGAPSQPGLLRGFHGNTGYGLENEMYWGSSNRDVANAYSQDRSRFTNTQAGPSGRYVQEAEFRFKNPKEIDAQGRRYDNLPHGLDDPEFVAMDALDAGHDGLILRNIVDPPLNGTAPVADTYAALKRGTVFDPKTGRLIFSNPEEAAPLSLLSQGKDTPQGSQAADPYREALRMKARAKALGINP